MLVEGGSGAFRRWDLDGRSRSQGVELFTAQPLVPHVSLIPGTLWYEGPYAHYGCSQWSIASSQWTAQTWILFFPCDPGQEGREVCKGMADTIPSLTTWTLP